MRLFVALYGHPYTVGIILTLPFLHIATESAEKTVKALYQMKNWQYGKRVHEYTHETFLSREWGCNQAPFSRLKIAFQYLNSWVTQLFRSGTKFQIERGCIYFLLHES